jgi:Amidohydrolase family
MKSAAIGVLLCCSFLRAAPGPKASESLIITNVNVVDTRYGSLSPNQTVIVKDGVIHSIVKIAIVGISSNVHVVNAEGRFLIPGLWDMNTHFSRREVEAWNQQAMFAHYLANGVTGVRNMDALVAERPQNLDDWKPEIEGAEPAWAPHLKRGAEVRPIHERRTIEDLDEVVLACSSRESGLTQSAPNLASFQDSGANSFLASDRSYNVSAAHDLFVRMSNQATWIVPSLSSRGDPHNIGGAVQLSQIRRDFELVKEMRRTGMQFLTGTNGPSAESLPGISLHRELELLVASGFTPLQALQAATFNPALYMAKLDKYGVVERGHIANMILLDGNPLTDIRNTQKIAGVVLRGKYFSRIDLDRLRSKVDNERISRTTPPKAYN